MLDFQLECEEKKGSFSRHSTDLRECALAEPEAHLRAFGN